MSIDINPRIRSINKSAENFVKSVVSRDSEQEIYERIDKYLGDLNQFLIDITEYLDIWKTQYEYKKIKKEQLIENVTYFRDEIHGVLLQLLRGVKKNADLDLSEINKEYYNHFVKLINNSYQFMDNIIPILLKPDHLMIKQDIEQDESGINKLMKKRRDRRVQQNPT